MIRKFWQWLHGSRRTDGNVLLFDKFASIDNKTMDALIDTQLAAHGIDSRFDRSERWM